MDFLIFIVVVVAVISNLGKAAKKQQQNGRGGAPSPWQRVSFPGKDDSENINVPGASGAHPGGVTQSPYAPSMSTIPRRKPFSGQSGGFDDAPRDTDSAPQGSFAPDALSGQMTIMELDQSAKRGCDDGYGSLEHTSHEGDALDDISSHSDSAANWQPMSGSLGAAGSSSAESFSERAARQDAAKRAIQQRRDKAGPGSLTNRPLIESRLSANSSYVDDIPGDMNAAADFEATPELLGEKLDAQAMRRAVIYSEILNKRGGRHGWVRI